MIKSRKYQSIDQISIDIIYRIHTRYQLVKKEKKIQCTFNCLLSSLSWIFFFEQKKKSDLLNRFNNNFSLKIFPPIQKYLSLL